MRIQNVFCRPEPENANRNAMPSTMPGTVLMIAEIASTERFAQFGSLEREVTRPAAYANRQPMIAVITATYSEFVNTCVSSGSVNMFAMCANVGAVLNGHSETNGMSRITANTESVHTSTTTEAMPHAQSRRGPLGRSTWLICL
nr:hypothetical protein [Bifidobacterium miconis]